MESLWTCQAGAILTLSYVAHMKSQDCKEASPSATPTCYSFASKNQKRFDVNTKQVMGAFVHSRMLRSFLHQFMACGFVRVPVCRVVDCQPIDTSSLNRSRTPLLGASFGAHVGGSRRSAREVATTGVKSTARANQAKGGGGARGLSMVGKGVFCAFRAL